MNYQILFIKFILIHSILAQDLNGNNAKVDSNNSGSIGTVMLNGEVYNQISFRPIIALRKLQIGFDIYMYFNEEGLYLKSWDLKNKKSIYSTILDKIYFIRFGKPNDKIYIKLGAIPSITIGKGILVSNYSNITEYPQVRQTGLNLRLNYDRFGIEILYSNLKTLTPGVIALNSYYSITNKFQASISFVTDLDQLSSLPDADNDNYPNYYDLYPYDNNKYDDRDYYRNIYKSILKDSYTHQAFDYWYNNSTYRNYYEPNLISKTPYQVLL